MNTTYCDSEKWLEKELVRRVRQMGGKALKYSNNAETGYPDRLIILPTGYILWAEIKSKGETPRKIQQYRIAELERLLQEVWVVDSLERLDELTERISNKINQ